MSKNSSDNEKEQESDQEKLLDDALLIVKSQAYQMKTAIENNKLRNSLKFAKSMLDTLKSTTLSPTSYYHLYTSIFDEMQYIFNYFREEARRGRRMKDLYDTVQQCENIIPRLFLLICVASAYIETGQVNATDIIFDLFNLIKGVQNPLRGLFCRYFFLKMIKDKLPDKGNEFEKPGATPEDSIKFILSNLEEMNGLWIRLSTITDKDEKLVLDSERAQLKLLIGENITRLASLNCINIEIYQNKVLPKILEILLEGKDAMSQQYLIECLIQAFPDEFNIKCMNILLETCSKLQGTVDIISLFITLMDKLAKFVNNTTSPNEEETAENKNEREKSEQIFALLKGNIEKVMNDNSTNLELSKMIELEVAFIRFTINCSPEKGKLESVNFILSDCVSILAKSKADKNNKDIVKLIGRLLAAPLESKMSIFSMPSFPDLMKYLDYASRTTLALRIIESLVNNSNTSNTNTNIKLDSCEKISALMDFIRPLLEDSPDAGEFDQIQFEYEQNYVCKILNLVSTDEPQKMYDMICILKNVFIKGGIKRIKFTLPTLVNTLLIIAYKIAYAYAKNENIEDDRKTAIHKEFCEFFNIKTFDSSDMYTKFMKRIYNQAVEVISIIENDFPETAIKLYLSLAIQINSVQVGRDNFVEYAYNAFTSAIQLFNKSKINEDMQVDLIHQMIDAILNLNCLSRNDYLAIASNIVQASQTILKKGSQCLAIMACSNLFFNTPIADKAKLSDCLSKAKKFADFAMTNPQNAILFIYIINKYCFFLEKAFDENEVDFISAETINDLIELVKNHIQSMKIENKNAEYLPRIEEYFNNTIDMLVTRKKEGKNKVFANLMI